MDNKTLTEILLEEKSDHWPERYRQLRIPLRSPSAETRAKILQTIAEAVAEEERRQTNEGCIQNTANTGGNFRIFRLRSFRLAVAALIPVAAVGVFFLIRSVGNMELVVTAYSGRGQLIRNGQSSPLAIGRSLQKGDRLILTEGESLSLLIKDIVLRMRGPGKYQISRLNTSDIIDLIVYIERGRIQVQSPYDSTKHLVWRTPTADCTMTGTRAELQVGEELQELVVSEGEFQIRFTKLPDMVRVGAGQAYRWPISLSSGDPLPNVEPIQKVIPEKAARDDIDTEGEGDRSLTLGEIKKRYGSLQRVHLADHRTYVGHVISRGRLIRIHTTYGIIEVDKELVRSISKYRGAMNQGR